MNGFTQFLFNGLKRFHFSVKNLSGNVMTLYFHVLYVKIGEKKYVKIIFVLVRNSFGFQKGTHPSGGNRQVANLEPADQP